jgi:hypothetical protein
MEKIVHWSIPQWLGNWEYGREALWAIAPGIA